MPGRVCTPSASTCLLLKGLADVPWRPEAWMLGTQIFTLQLDQSHVLTLVLAAHSHSQQAENVRTHFPWPRELEVPGGWAGMQCQS